MPRYAQSTDVSSDRSRAEIERTLARYGATTFTYGWSGDRAAIGFVMDGRQIRFVLPLPDRTDNEFTLTPTGQGLGVHYEQAVETQRAVLDATRLVRRVVTANHSWMMRGCRLGLESRVAVPCG